MGAHMSDRLVGHFKHYIANICLRKLGIEKFVEYEKPGAWNTWSKKNAVQIDPFTATWVEAYGDCEEGTAIIRCAKILIDEWITT